MGADDRGRWRPVRYTEPPRWRHIVLTFLVLVIALAPIPTVVEDLQRRTRGVVFGVPPRWPHTDVVPYAVNADLVPLNETELARALDLLVQAGFGWVRLRFPWFAIETAPGQFTWEPWDRVVQEVTARGLQIIALVDGTPPWYRPPGEEDNPVVPPTDLSAFARFAARLAARYATAIDYYQVWDQPNVTPFWGNRQVDPAAYVDMLREVGGAIREADETAYILSAGLAPTTLQEPYHMSDVAYLRAMYQAGARGTFDILGAKAYDLEGDDPWQREYREDRLGIARLVLLREVMERFDDGDTPVWVVGWGRHATPPGWTGRPSIWGTVSEAEQARYVYEVFRRKRLEWPWLGVLTWDQFYPQVPLDDPLWGFALLRPDWQPRPVYFAFRDLATGPPLIGIGRYGPTSWIWQNPDPELRHALLVEGTYIALVAGELVAVEASLDGQERSALLDPGREHVLGNQLALQPHTLVLRFDPPGVTTLVVGRNRPLGPYMALGVLALVALVALARLTSWAFWPPTEPIVLPGLIAVLTAFYIVAPTLPLSLFTLALIAAIFWFRPRWALVAVMGVLPFVAVTKVLGRWQFSLVETYILLAAIGWAGRWGVQAIVAASASSRALLTHRLRRALEEMWSLLRPREPLDVAALALLGVAAVAAASARYQEVAWREYRWVVLEPVMFYWMMRVLWREEVQRQMTRARARLRTWLQRYTFTTHMDADVVQVAVPMIHGLLWGMVGAVTLGAALLVWQPMGAYAEGVWRLRGVYGSPNNMALVLGRGVAYALALALFLRSTSSISRLATWPKPIPGMSVRRGYALLGGVLLLGLVATFSRGALLLGVPVLVMILAWQAPRSERRYLLLLLAALLVIQVPFWMTDRFRSLVTGAGTLALRVDLWRASVRMVRDHWWWGVGPDNFLYYFREAYLPAPDYPEPNLSHPHNLILHFWLALGLPGLLWLIATLAAFIWTARRLTRFLPPESTSRALVIAALAALGYSLAHGLVDQSFLLPDLMVLFWFGAAILASIHERVRTR